MPTERVILAYKFSELSDEVKEKVHEDYLKDFQFYDEDLSHWEVFLELLGFEDPQINWSGFHTQGSGASFIADIDTMKLASTLIYCCDNFDEAWMINGAVEVIYSASVVRTSNMHSHERTCCVSWEMDYFDDALEHNIAAKCGTVFAEKAEELRLSLCHKIYSSIQADYEYQTSMEAFEETCDCNDWEFNKNGELI